MSLKTTDAMAVYHHFDFAESVLTDLKPAFSREAAFMWFATQVLGQITRSDDLGVSSTVRAFRLETQAYESLIDLFRSKAWDAQGLRESWYRSVAARAPLLEVKGRAVLCSDGVKVAKEGLRMPGVKRLHQESADSGKGEHILGHMLGAVGVLAESPFGARHCIPLKINLQDGMRAAASWEGACEVGVSLKTHPVQSVECAFEAAQGLGKSCYLAMDRYFMCVPALRRARELNTASGGDEPLIHIITRTRRGCVAWEEPKQESSRRGRPRKRGAKVDLFALFDDSKASFKPAGDGREVLTVDLLWGQGLYLPVRFVLVRQADGGKLVLVSTDRSLSPKQVIDLYAARWGVECAFRDMKQDVAAFSYRFWSSAVPPLDRFAPSGAPDRLASVEGNHERSLVLAAYGAVERYVACSCVATGILQMLALAEPPDGAVAYSEYRRSSQPGKVSVRAVRSHMRSRISSFVVECRDSPIARFIRKRRAGPGGYAPSARRKGRR